MSKKRSEHNKNHRFIIHFLAVLVISILQLGQALASAPEYFSTSRPEPSILTPHWDAVTPAASACFQTRLPSPGVLAVELVSQERTGESAQLVFLPPALDPDDPRRPRVLDAFNNGYSIEIHAAGSYQFCVLSQKAQARGASHKILSGFAPAPLRKSEDPKEEEPEIEPIVFVPLALEDPKEEEPEIEPIVFLPLAFEDPKEEEPEIEPVVFVPSALEDPKEEEPEIEPILSGPLAFEDPKEEEPEIEPRSKHSRF